MTQSSDLPNLSRSQQKQLQDNCKDLQDKLKVAKENFQALMENNQITTVSYDVVEGQNGLETETFILYGTSVTNQITQSAGTDFRLGKLDVAKGEIVWSSVKQNFDGLN